MSGETDVLEAARLYGDRKRAHVNAVNAYNAELKRQRERGIFPVRVDPEYQAMQMAEKAMWAALRSLDEALAGEVERCAP